MHDGVPGGLAGAVLVVVVVLGLGVVDGHHGAGQDALPLPGVEAVDAGGGLLAAADEPVTVLGALAPQEVDQIAAVVHNQVRTALQGLHQEVLILLHVHAVDAVGIHTGVGHGGGHIVLGGQGVAAGEVDLGSPLPEDQAQVGCLGLQMDGYGDGQSRERLFPAKSLLNAAEGGHKIPYPLNFLMARRGQRHVFHNTHGNPPYLLSLLRWGFGPIILAHFPGKGK